MSSLLPSLAQNFFSRMSASARSCRIERNCGAVSGQSSGAPRRKRIRTLRRNSRRSSLCRYCLNFFGRLYSQRPLVEPRRHFIGLDGRPKVKLPSEKTRPALLRCIDRIFRFRFHPQLLRQGDDVNVIGANPGAAIFRLKDFALSFTSARGTKIRPLSARSQSSASLPGEQPLCSNNSYARRRTHSNTSSAPNRGSVTAAPASSARYTMSLGICKKLLLISVD